MAENQTEREHLDKDGSLFVMHIYRTNHKRQVLYIPVHAVTGCFTLKGNKFQQDVIKSSMCMEKFLIIS